VAEIASRHVTGSTDRAGLGAWGNESTFGASTALAFQVIPKVVLGAELWYLPHYEGVAFNTSTGDAVLLGPTFYWKIAPRALRTLIGYSDRPTAMQLCVYPAVLCSCVRLRRRSR
jgi:hypothetical protein